MADKSTFIKIDRNIEKWRWYMNGNTFRVFIHLILNANIKDHEFESVTIHRGQLATSYPKIATSLNLTVDEVRTAISHLKLTGEITVRRYTRFQVFSIVCYDKYQMSSQSNSQSNPIQIPFISQSNPNNQRIIRNKEWKENNISADQTADAVGGEAEKESEITLDENGCDTRIPPMFRNDFKRYEDYMEWRYQ